MTHNKKLFVYRCGFLENHIGFIFNISEEKSAGS